MFATIPKRKVKQRSVREAQAWVSDIIIGALTVGVIVEYLHLWDILSAVTLQSQEEDKHIWKFSANAQYSAKSAYESFFHRSHFFWALEKDLEILGSS